MTPNKTTIKEFFEGEKQYIIPVYQRAYSWEEEQWKDFLADLEEATKGENHYFFGNVLLEKLSGDKTNDIIDGQQRITTIIIFVRALCNVLKEKAKNERLDNEISNEDFLKYIEEDYLINRSKAKLQAVEYDRDYFKDVIINNDDKKHEPQTPSQERIKKAKVFFIKALKSKENKEILDIFQALQNAEILSIPFANKKDSVLMFELQNNRGKKLTNMEKLKSYLAYQIYTYCDKEDSEVRLKEITSIFETIYRLINDIKIADEDSILNYFNISYSKFGFNYRENDNDVNYKKQYKQDTENKSKSNGEKIAWIENYVKELKNAFINFKEFEKMESVYKDYLLMLDSYESYPFVLKAYHLFGDNKEKLEEVYKALEIMIVRHKIVKTSANLAARLDNVLKNFNNIESLVDGLKEICVGNDRNWYWGDEEIKRGLCNIYEQKKQKIRIAPYLLMRYENYLRNDDIHTKGYKFSLKEIQTPEIEHIAPQTENGEELSSGYCEYDEEFYNDYYLHCIGNLLLINKPHNISIGNKPFKDKLASYENSPLIQQREIKDFVVNKGVWDKDAINTRHEELEKFVLETWSFEKNL
ncbi:DUF262 domain-containing HNH endonuclease family protein [Helicobacter sp. MIT 21-1697]|uniref:DUF262 domain-containing protein n=1 Tax=Helicobacter sp. MIT 21-1697 TaxID=2993733 RepID=UPI00224AC57C|nr:DUF262 domain-containing HNH endonuclease family protein [Helicobacter sp. MIT 21-1697]MCX2717462.1 DUF262 domain-containing HNH endonuclease family protein [Helicobacter sp. MIT 21-1697]